MRPRGATLCVCVPPESNRTKLMIPESSRVMADVSCRRVKDHARLPVPQRGNIRDLEHSSQFHIAFICAQSLWLSAFLSFSLPLSFASTWPLGPRLNCLINSIVLWYNISDSSGALGFWLFSVDLRLNYHQSCVNCACDAEPHRSSYTEKPIGLTRQNSLFRYGQTNFLLDWTNFLPMKQKTRFQLNYFF